MATLAFSAAGAGLGSLTGVGSSAGWQIGSVLGRVLFPAEEGRTGGLTDLKISGSAYGQVIPVLFGTMRLGGNVIWAGPLTREAVSAAGGKGGGAARSNSGYINRASFALALCRGVMGDVIKIWADGALIYDAQSSDIKKQADLHFRFYPGSEDQSADSLIAADMGAEMTPAYRGICYLVFDSLDLSPYGNRLPNIEVLVTEAGAADYPQSSGTSENYHPDQMLIRGDGEYVYSYEVDGGTNVFRKINTRSLTIEGEVTVGVDFPEIPSSLSGMSVDRDGHIWVGTGYGTLPGRGIHKINTDIMALERETSLPSGVGAVTYSTDIRPFDSGLSFQVAGSQQSGGIVVFDPLLNVMTTEAGSALSCSGAVRDDSETAWIVMSGNIALDPVSDVNIFRINIARRPSGEAESYAAAIERFDIPSADLTAGIVANNVTELVCLLPRRGELVLKNNHRIFKWSLQSQTITASRDGDFSDLTSLPQSNSDNAILFRTGGGEVTYLDADSLANLESVDLTQFDGVTGFEGAAYDEGSDSLIILKSGEPVRKLRLRRVKGGSASYADMIGGILSLSGLQSEDYDLSDVTGEVDGYVINREGSLQSALEPILTAARLDLCETGYQLKFMPRGGDIRAEIPHDELLSQPSFTRLQESELPERVSVRYLASDGGFLPGAQSEARADRPVPTMYGRRELSVNLAMAMPAAAAKSICQNSLRSAWAERDLVQFALPTKYLYLDPSDRVRLIMGSGTQEVQIAQSHLQPDLAQDISALGGLAAASFTTVAAADAGSGYVEPQLARSRLPEAFIFNGALIREEDATGGSGTRVYYALTNPDQAPAGSALYHSDNNYRFEQVGVSGGGAAYGIAVNALTATETPWRTDKSSYLDLEIMSGSEQFESMTFADLSSGRNALLLGSEILQFMAVDWLTTSRVRLSGLIRARRGTEAAITGHKIGERGLLLTSHSLKSVKFPLSAIGMRHGFKAVGAGMLPEEAAPQMVTLPGGDLKPFAPVHLSAERSEGEITVRWVRRSRAASGSFSASPPISEGTERYEICLEGGGQSRSRYVEGEREFLYTLADYNADFGASETEIPPLNLTLYQLSEAIGRGFPAVKEAA